MSSRPDIQAGRAYVSLYVKQGGFQKALQRAQKNLAAFGSTLTKIGAGGMAAGTSILGPLVGASKVFADTGSALTKMSKQTGESVANLSALQYAASQTGVDFDDVIGSIEELNIRMGETIRDGTGPAAEAFKNLGLEAAELAKMNPADRMAAVSDALADIQDETRRGFLADEIFGGDAFKILPLIGQGSEAIRKMTDEARQLGLVMSGEDAQAASEFASALRTMQSVAMGLVNQLGAAVAPMFTQLAERMTEVGAAIINIVRKNRPLVATVAKVAAGVTAAGAVLVAIGGAAMGAAAALGGLATVVGGLATAMAVAGPLALAVAKAVVTIGLPIAAITAALGGAVYAFFRFTEVGQATMEALRSIVGTVLSEVSATFRTMFGGLADAILSGNLAAAGQIAFKGLQLSIMQVMQAIDQQVTGIFGQTILGITRQLLSGDLVGTFTTVALSMAAVWDGFTAGIVNTFTSAAKMAVQIWKQAVKMIMDGISNLASQGGIFEQVFGGIAGKAMDKAVNASDKLLENAFGDGKLDAVAGNLTSALDAVGNASSNQAASSSQALANNAQRESTDSNDAVARLQAEINALRMQIQQDRERQNAMPFDNKKGDLPVKGAGPASAAMFSAAGVIASTQGTAMTKQITLLEKQIKVQLEQKANQIALITAVKNLQLLH